jgi:hypothetical protein
MPEIKAIETRYKGYRMRSRLEARYAVLFDALPLDWTYEPEGYDLGPAGFYLPDFWLPQVRMWAEVKPEPLTPEERAKCSALVIATRYPCLMLVGTPEVKPYDAICVDHGLVHHSDDVYDCDFVISNHKQYPRDEHRFYCCTCTSPTDWPDEAFRMGFQDLALAVAVARSARFEHGEAGR